MIFSKMVFNFLDFACLTNCILSTRYDIQNPEYGNWRLDIDIRHSKFTRYMQYASRNTRYEI